MALPVFRIQGEIGKQVDGSLKHIQVPIVSQVVKAVSRVAALYIELDGSSTAIGAALLCMTWNAVFVCPDEHGVVIFRILIERSRPREVRMCINPNPQWGGDWWAHEFTLKDGTEIFYRDKDMPTNWAETYGAEYSLQGSPGKVITLDFNNGTGEIK